MTAKTPVYQLEYIVQGEPARNARLALENNAKSIEAALIRGGIAPPLAPDLATLAGRVTTLELPAVNLVALDTALYGPLDTGMRPAALKYGTDPTRGRVAMRGAFTNSVTPFAASAGNIFRLGSIPAALAPARVQKFVCSCATGAAWTTAILFVNPVVGAATTADLQYIPQGALVSGFQIDLSSCAWQLGV